MTIVQKQKQLQFLGYYKGNIDGIWGSQSIAATKAFQADNGLLEDGIFGRLTEQKTMELVVAIQMKIGANVDGIVGSETISKYQAYQNKKGDSNATQTATDFWGEIKHFKRSEFACKCGKCGGFPVEPNEDLVRLLDKVREHFGKPTRVNSGIRCTTHNKNVGGATKSQHLYGTAADIRVDGVAPLTLYKYLETLLPNSGGIGLYVWGCHVDVRAAKARWQ